MKKPIQTGLLPALNESLETDFPLELSIEQLKEKLCFHINHLIQHDFRRLVTVLYRVDVDELKLKNLLKDNSDKDAALIITDLIIERQLQKIKSRQEFNQKDTGISNEEKW